MSSLVRRCNWTLVFEKDDETTAAVNSKRYDRMITDFFWPAIEEHDLGNMWFEQDGAICNTTVANMALLQETFPNIVISRCGDIN